MHARRVARNALARYRSERLLEARAKRGGAAEPAERRQTQSEVNAERKALISERFASGLAVIQRAVCRACCTLSAPAFVARDPWLTLRFIFCRRL